MLCAFRLCMPNWILKSIIHRSISLLPNRQFWNRSLQAVTKSLELSPEKFEIKVAECARQLAEFERAKPGVNAFTAVELGTGWYPIIATGYFLCGASEVWTYDIEPLLEEGCVGVMGRYFCEYADSGRLQKLLPGLLPDRLAQLRTALQATPTRSPEEVLESLHIHVRVQDAQHTGLPPASADLVASSGVLEYIPREILANILAEFRRIAKPDSVMFHRINLIDQYAYFDHQITPFNYLRFSPQAWRWLNSPLIWQSRLRISDYRELFSAAGFQIVKEDDEPGSVEDLLKVPLAPEFRNYKQEDLLVLISWLVARVV